MGDDRDLLRGSQVSPRGGGVVVGPLVGIIRTACFVERMAWCFNHINADHFE